MAFEKDPKLEKPIEEEKPEEGFKKEGDLWVPEEGRGHVRSAEYTEWAKGLIPEEKKIESEEEKEKEWKYGARTLERIRDAEREWAEEKKAMESAKIPEKGMEAEEILKEAGVEKPVKSFAEAEEKLEEKIGKARTQGGEKIPLAEKNEITLNFYLGELGYSVRYKDFLHGKAELLDENSEVVKDEGGKPMEFKTFFKMDREETPMIDFLKEKLREKQEKKPAKEMSEEEEMEAGFQKTKKAEEQKQEGRKEKVSSLKDVKETGKERINKLAEGLSYIAALDKLGLLGLKKSKDIAIEGGKDLAAIGLTPAAAVEEAGRYIAGRIQVGEAVRKNFIMEKRAELLEKIPADKRPDYFDNLLEAVVKTGTERVSEELISGYDKIYKKGKIIKLIEMLGGKVSRPIGRTFGPPSPSSPEKI